jgi:homoserine dehydrogenase
VPDQVIVLKLGGSVLRDERDLERGVHEAYHWVRKGYGVVVVVSAFEGTTDRLLKQASSFVEDSSEESARALVATGEFTTASLLGLALRKAGVTARVLWPQQISLRTEGAAADGAPVSVDAGAIRQALDSAAVVVVPGFVGVDVEGSYTLLGRGGSDLTALFLAAELGARCRLIKDVDGLYEWDPARPGKRPRRFARCSFERALKLDGGIVQHKAVRLARDRGLEFEVGCFGAASVTRVGSGGDQRAADGGHTCAPRRMRVALLGAGVVGGGVYEHLRRHRDRFRVVSIAVRDVEKAAARGLPRELLTTDAVAAARGDCDAVIELIGGVEPPESAIRAALEGGKHVVTANKRLLSECGGELETLADAQGVSLRHSAAVGGGVPMLETVARLAARENVLMLEGVVNGTTNFVLGRLAAGESLEDAVRGAQERGLAERDPSADLHGLDAAQKLALLCAAAGWPRVLVEEIEREPLTEAAWERAAAPGATVRQVARAEIRDGRVTASVKLASLPPDHPLSRTRGAGNALMVRTASGTRTVAGTGAGRWPTSESVLADLFDLHRELAMTAAAEPQGRAAARTQGAPAVVLGRAR